MTRSARFLLLSAACAMVAACSGVVGPLPCTKDLECPADSFCNTDGKCKVGTATTCTPPLASCSGQCLNLSGSDANNCGTCGHVCTTPTGASGSLCAAGVCDFTCPAGTAKSGGGCAVPTNPPGVPTGLAANASGASITLTWTASAGADSYRLSRGTSASGPFGTRFDTSGAPFTDNGLAPGTTFFYVIAAHGPGGFSADSGTVFALTAPPAAGALSVTASGATTSLSWSRAAGALAYDVYRATSPTAGGTPIASPADPNAGHGAGGDTQTFSDGPLSPPGTTFFYKVTAKNDAGVAAASKESSATIAPGAVSGLTAAFATNPSPAHFTLTWQHAAGATSYSVLRATTAGAEAGTGISANDTGSGTQTVADASGGNFIAGATYFYKVVASNAAGSGTGSNEASAAAPPPTPNRPTVTSATATSVTVSWVNVSGATGYVLSAGTGANKTFHQTVSPGAGGSSSGTLGGLQVGVTYFISVHGTNSGGDGGESGDASATTILLPPQNIVANAINDTNVQLVFDRAPGATSYLINRQPGAFSKQVSDPLGGQVTFPDQGLNSDTTYTYTVTSQEGTISSVASAPVTVLTLLPTPTNFLLEPSPDSGPNIPRLLWDQMPNALGYEIFRGALQGLELSYDSLAQPQGVTGPATYDDFSGAAAGGTIYYQVRQVSLTNHSALTSEASIQVTPGTFSFGIASSNPSNVTLRIGRLPGTNAIDILRGQCTPTPTLTCPTPGTEPLLQHLDLGLFPVVFFTDNSPLAGTSSYTVVAYAGSRTAPVRSAPMTQTLNLPAGQLFSPSSFRAMGCGGASPQVTLAWLQSAGATSYTLTRQPGGTVLTVPATSIVFNITNTVSTTDHGVSAGTAYTYNIIANGPSGSSALPGNAVSVSTTDGLCGTRMINQVLEDGEHNIPDPNLFNAVRVLVPAAVGTSSWKQIVALASPDGSWTAGPLVSPANPGYFVVRRGGQAFVLPNAAEQPQLDLSADLAGRAVIVPGSFTTGFDIHLTGMTPWNANDNLEMWSLNTGLYSFGSQGSGLPAGATSFDTPFFDLSFFRLLDAALGDSLMVTHMSTRTSSANIAYKAVNEAFSTSSITNVEGAATPLAGAFSPITSEALGVSLKVARSTYSAFKLAVNPAAVPSANSVIIDAPPAYATHGGFSSGVDLLIADLDLAGTDLNLGTMTFNNPFPPLYQLRANVGQTWRIDYDIGNTGAPNVVPFFVSSADQTDLNSFLARSSTGNGVEALIGPPTAPMINGNDLFTPQTGVGLSPRISWSPPSLGDPTLGNPTYYAVRIWFLYLDPLGKGGLGLWSSTINTTRTDVQLPAFPGFQLAPVDRLPFDPVSYLVAITAVYEPSRQFATRPLKRFAPGSASATLVSAPFTP